MNNLSQDLKVSEARVAASSANIQAQLELLKSRVHALTTSPYVIGGIAVGAVATGYLTASRKTSHTALPHPPAPTRLMRVSQMAQMMAPFLSVLAAAIASRQIPKSNTPVTSDSARADQLTAE